MATGYTDYSVYGLSDTTSRLRKGDVVNMSNENKVNQFAADMWEIFDSAGNLLLKKHRDYGPTNISLSPGGPLNGLRVRMHDKTARINHLIDSGATPENESLRDSFIDLLNYSAIALMVLDGVWPKSLEADCD
jgi:hypothetical protein